MPASKRTQPSTHGDRRLKKRPKPTSTSVVKTSSNVSSVVDLTDDQDDMPVRSSQSQLEEGLLRWRADFEKLKRVWKAGEIEGYGGLIASIQDFQQGGTDHSAHFSLHYEDMDGRESSFGLTMAFDILSNYPYCYTMRVYGDQGQSLPRRANRTFPKFIEVFDLDIREVTTKLIMALQGDDEADAGKVPDLVPEELEWEEADIGIIEGPGTETHIRGMDYSVLKQHFEQAKSMGYRPGLSNVSGSWVISYSIPFRNLSIDPNTLRMWDDGLVDAWESNQRFTLLMVVDQYPAHIDRMKCFVGSGPHYKPPLETIEATTRSVRSGSTSVAKPLDPFYLSGPISNYLKSFGRCYKLRTAFELNWNDADGIGLDEVQSHRVFQDDWRPPASQQWDESDPIVMGFEHNTPLVAFWWALRRFTTSPNYCLNCGLKVKIPSLRPYVCDKPLCLYGFMSLGLGPSVEHVIRTQPSVVDLLLSFAYSAAMSKTRMEMPLGLHIELESGELLDTAEDKFKALADLLNQIPSVTKIKKKLDQGARLKDIGASAGAITVLRWVIGSCRAYLKETKPGEGVIEDTKSQTNMARYGMSAGSLRQFTFVVGSPEQEESFQAEIAKAQKTTPNCRVHPTILAFHGSGAERWHNILRTGLDYSETVCGRAYGNGVYFAPDAHTSMTAYARANQSRRKHADLPLMTATALVELVNVPSTFVSSNPYYVVSNVKQIKPFLLLVTGSPKSEDPSEETTTSEAGAGATTPVQPAEPPVPVKPRGKLFKHDPSLPKTTTYGGTILKVTMPEVLTSRNQFDVESGDAMDADMEEDDETDSKIFNPVVLQPKFNPSPHSRLAKLQLMPPPNQTSVIASKTLAKEFKSLVKLQNENALPFYINPESDSLYCWVLELFEFPASRLKEDMKKFKVNSIVTEVRFPASFPHSPPFMRILHPRCMPFVSGGGGNVTAGGSICNEILTATGWNPAYCVEAMVRDIMTNMTEATPPARLDPIRWDVPYTLVEAVEAFKRVAAAHGWEVPKDFDKMT